MDPHLQNAHSRIRVFLADLNLVLGSTSYATPYKPAPVFNHIVCPQNLALRGPHQQLRLKRPTNRSRAWKINHRRNNCDQSEKAPHHGSPITSTKHFSTPAASTVWSSPNRRYDNVYNRREHYRRLRNPHEACQIRPTLQHFSREYPDRGREVKVDYPSALADNHLLLEPPSDEMIEEQETDCISDHGEIDLDQIEWDDRSDLDINAAPNYQPDTDQTFAEDLDIHLLPRTDSNQQPEPTFDLKNYSANDVNCWASTLSADEFEHLRIMGPDARTESFRQYATLHIDQLSQPHSPLNSLPPQSNQALHNQNIYPTTNETDNHSIPSHHPDQFNPSDYYEHSNYCASDLDESPENKSVIDDSGFNGVFDDSGFDDGGFDDGGFNDSGFDDGGFDDGGFDDGGFDDGGFDDSGFDDGGFDDDGFDGGFDDGYGSTY